MEKQVWGVCSRDEERQGSLRWLFWWHFVLQAGSRELHAESGPVIREEHQGQVLPWLRRLDFDEGFRAG